MLARLKSLKEYLGSYCAHAGGDSKSSLLREAKADVKQWERALVPLSVLRHGSVGTETVRKYFSIHAVVYSRCVNYREKFEV